MKPVIEMSVAELARSFDELIGEFQPETYLARGAVFGRRYGCSTPTRRSTMPLKRFTRSASSTIMCSSSGSTRPSRPRCIASADPVRRGPVLGVTVVMEICMQAPIEISQLGDDELAALGAQWRARALHGDRDANGKARELEQELRRRRGALSTDELRRPALKTVPWWAFWRK